MKKNKIILTLCSLVLLFSSCSNNSSSSQEMSSESSLESSVNNSKYVDVFAFMGQSNMAGRGDAETAITVGEGHAYEFRAISDPTKLYPMAEPFGNEENKAGGLSDTNGDGGKKNGGLVSAFCEAYYQNTGVPVVGVSCSEGGTNSDEWQIGGGKIEDAKERLELCLMYLASQDEFNVRNINMVWLQGESDAGNGRNYDYYTTNMNKVVDEMQSVGVDKCFLITIGNYMKSVNEDRYNLYKVMQDNQALWAKNEEDVVLVSIKLEEMGEDLMHLSNHFLQPAYNVVGNDAGKNTAYYINTGKEPVCKEYVLGEEFDINPVLDEG